MSFPPPARSPARKKYDLAFQGYINSDGLLAEADLKNSLATLTAQVKASGVTTVAHPVQAGATLDELMRTAEESEEAMHEKVEALCTAMGALLYEKGPLKRKERVEEKMAADYGNDFRQVVGEWTRSSDQMLHVSASIES